jgi:hypothetical protein
MLLFPAMSYSSRSLSPQLGTAEYFAPAGGDHCQYCHQPIGTIYYLANAARACPSCADKLRNPAAAFGRAVLFGIGAAALGLALYAAFTIITHIAIGYASLAVGWMVAKGMVKGSGGVTGRRYQIVAGMLTYAACALASIPVWIYQMQIYQLPELRSLFLSDIPHTLLLPFLRLADNPFGGLIGLIILFVGVSVAVRLTAPRAFTIGGPFANSWPARG